MSDQQENFESPAMRQVVKTQASPGAIAEAMEDPTVFEQISRGDLYLELTRLRRLAASNAMPINRRIEYAQFLAKMGKVDKPEADSNPLNGVPAINIYLPGSQQSTQLAGATLPGEYTEKDNG